MDEGTTTVTNVNSSDDGTTDPSSITYSLSGADAAPFTLNSASGALSVNSVPNFESPSDAGRDGVYEVTVTVTDDVGQSDTQDISITVDDINDDPTGSVTIAGTAAEDQILGYESLSQFSREYRRLFGEPPTSARASSSTSPEAFVEPMVVFAPQPPKPN